MKPRKKKMRVEKSEEYGEIGCLSSDVLCDVLSRLPVKSLSRFKCVSKGWLNLIKNDTFVQLHLTRSKQNGTGRFLRICIRRSDDFHVPKARFYKLDEEEEDGRVAPPKVVGEVVCFRFPTLPPPCNGLVCYMSRSYHIKVCNPITHQTLTLPKPRFVFRNRVKKLKRVMLGIGYVSSEKIYKVVVAWSTHTGSSGVEIFTLGGDTKASSWRSLSSQRHRPLLSDPYCQYATPVYANGALYWHLTEYFEDEYGDPFHRYSHEIISFNFAQEKFNLIPVPDDVDCLNHVCWICELHGHLCLLERPEYGPTVKMWMLMNNNNHHHWVTQKIPSNLIWVGTISMNQHHMSLVRQGKDQVTLHSGLYHSEGHLIKPTDIHPRLHRHNFEVAQFHQESLVSLTNAVQMKS